MTHQDAINAVFELVGAAVTWLNIQKLYLDKKVTGVYWPIWAFFSVWGYWNLYYYSSIGHLLSTAAGTLLALGNTVWVLLAWTYRNNR